MMLKIDKFEGGLEEFKAFAKRQWVLEVTGKEPKGRVKVGEHTFESSEAFNEWAQALDAAGWNKLADAFVEFPDRGAVSLE